ncbi:8-amino-7-oxononanoate synthase [uncultured Chitinophaga sp.]|uniref:aminotransferase class I/II-fold pyridoxal phosphate-dependent enzyme n=1 Tax=uncultured Chitinophaga sp. TaxID=339340 RepID=UPI0025D06DF5|nr:8-amino-7-oxononanoate synthase [uncultured Chitinophaga sp.]
MRKEDFLQRALEKRQQEDALRSLKLSGGKTDFCSNDYLGLARSEALREATHAIATQFMQLHGSGGSRLLAGNYALIEEAERILAEFHKAPAGLIYNSGYDANLGLFSSVPQRGDTILYDQLIHASIHDGMRLSLAKRHSFGHNDLDDLQKKLSVAEGNMFVAVESVYSMDGDKAPLKEIADICARHGAQLIVDEAHATGVTGPQGAGLVQELGLEDACFARVHTFGKAVGCHGAIVLGLPVLKTFLVNFSRSFIYTTALPASAIAAVLASYNLFPSMEEERTHLLQLIRRLRNGIHESQLLNSDTPIQIIMTPGNTVARGTAQRLQAAGLDVRAILHPTVPKGEERLRVVLHAFNTEEEVDQLIWLIKADSSTAVEGSDTTAAEK